MMGTVLYFLLFPPSPEFHTFTERLKQVHLSYFRCKYHPIFVSTSQKRSKGVGGGAHSGLPCAGVKMRVLLPD